MHKRATTWVLSILLALLHAGFVAVPVIASHGNGEGQGMLAALCDFPLLIVFSLVAHRFGTHLGDNLGVYILLVSVGGTLMWAAVGAYVGYFIDSIRDLVRRRLTTRSSEQAGR